LFGFVFGPTGYPTDSDHWAEGVYEAYAGRLAAARPVALGADPVWLECLRLLDSKRYSTVRPFQTKWRYGSVRRRVMAALDGVRRSDAAARRIVDTMTTVNQRDDTDSEPGFDW
jgi:hypothetical protein